MYIKSFEDIINGLKREPSLKKVAVVSAEDKESIEAAISAVKNKITEPIFIGNKVKIEEILTKIDVEVNDFKIYNADTVEDAAIIGVRLINEGKADFLMKGKLETGQLLKAVVDKNNGLGIGGIMSHVAFKSLPRYHKLLVITDGGMNLYPNLEQKKAIIENAVKALINLGYDKPKVGILAAVEKVNPKMPETIEAAQLKEMNEKGEIKNCIIEGPISFDLAICKERAIAKNYTSEVAGDADILVAPNITTGNILGKCLVEMAGAKMAGLVLGAKAPIVVTSRGSSMEEKYYSLAFAAAAARGI
ncbi:MAG: bifunctional enoyl-CoA hydratase/phosphate acetyltransferase [Firmicutes bacterium]|nr:bifunctional enoyl-CoA hydratase/phosphate acetyltransferase [Bacillota bacterium]